MIDYSVIIMYTLAMDAIKEFGTLGQRIREIRQESKLTAKDLANKVGVHPTYITYIEKHGKIPSPALLKKIQDTLDDPILDHIYLQTKYPEVCDKYENGQKNINTEFLEKAQALMLKKNPTPEEKKEDDLKTLYRKIVRALHPDSGHEMSPIEKEWWNQAQTAYKRKDREALRMISLKIEGSGKISIESVEQIGAIIEMCANLFAQQDEILYQKKRLRKNNVYRFWTSRSRPANRAKFKVELQAQLAYQARNLKSFVEESKQIFKDLDRAFSRTQMDDEGDDYRPKKEKGRGRGRGRRD